MPPYPINQGRLPETFDITLEITLINKDRVMMKPVAVYPYGERGCCFK